MELYKINSGVVFYGRDVSEMELRLSAGTYYVRISSANAFSDFYLGDIPVYNLSVVPAGKVEGIWFKHYMGNDISMGKTFFESGQEPGYVVKDDPSNNCIAIEAMAYYNSNPIGTLIAAPNVKLTAVVMNGTTGETFYGTAVSGQNGFFTIKIFFGDAVGLNSCYYEGTLYKYDYMAVMIYPDYDYTLGDTEYFYLLKKYE